MVEVKKYDLPDIKILEKQSTNDFEYFIWQPDKTYLVLGSSNRAESSLIIEQVIKDKIEIYKRPSGGESVILSPKTLVLATLIRTEKLEDPPKHFRDANTKIINALTQLGVKNVTQKGISDLAIGNKKIAGSSIYRRTNIVFFHCVLNVSEDTSLMEKYLLFPSKQPDYRLNRSHSDFVTSLAAEGYLFGKSLKYKLTEIINSKIHK